MEINVYAALAITITLFIVTALIGYGARLEQKCKSLEREKETKK